jgi:selenocysteine lyase/cysteine desulfurase
MPLYANTHTETSGTGLQTTRFREEARAIIKAAVGGGDDDVVIFCGSGATGAINKLIDILNLRMPADLDARSTAWRAHPGRGAAGGVHRAVRAPLQRAAVARVDRRRDHDRRGRRRPHRSEQLEEELQRFADRPLKIGSFSAASNVTGIGTDTRAIAALLHRHGALSFWDFAAAAPYVDIEMNMRDDRPDGHLVYKDAVFLSPHKFIGGPGTPGVLVAKRHLFRNRVPATRAAAPSQYVNPEEHRYLADPSTARRAARPAIIESIRAGLVFQLKEAVGGTRSARASTTSSRRAIEAWRPNPATSDPGQPRRVAAVDRVVRGAAPERYLHHNFVVALLNDLFGIQARGGCSCAGPYGHRLLGIDLERSARSSSARSCGAARASSPAGCG